MKAMRSAVRSKTMMMRALVAGCVLSGALFVTGCEKSAKDLMIEADSALQAGNVDRAESVLEEALKKEPNSSQAIILRSQVDVKKKQYKEAEERLLALWSKLESEKPSNDKEKIEQKRIRQLMEESYFPDLYRDWADSMDKNANPQKFEEVVSKGLKYDTKNPRLNTMLVDFLQERGEKLVAEGKKKEAADVFDKVGNLYALPKIRKEATARAAALRDEVEVEEIAQRFEQDLKPALVKDELYDAENKVIFFVAEGSIDRRGTPEEALAAAEPLLSAKIDAATRKIANVPEDVKLGAPTKTEFFKVVESEFKRGDFKVKASFPEEQLKAYARFAIDRLEKKQEEAKKGDEKKDEKKEGAEVKEEGKQEAPKEGDKPAEAKEEAK